MRELLDPKYGMFRYNEDSRLIWFSDKVCNLYDGGIFASVMAVNRFWFALQTDPKCG